MLLMTIFQQQAGPRLANKIPPNDNNIDFSYVNNVNVNNNKFSFSSASCSIVF